MDTWREWKRTSLLGGQGEPGTRRRGRPRVMDGLCSGWWESGGWHLLHSILSSTLARSTVDLDKVDDRIEWRRCRDDPTSLEGTNGKMMMIMMMHSSANIKTFKCLCILTSNRNHSEILLNYRLEDELFFITNWRIIQLNSNLLLTRICFVSCNSVHCTQWSNSSNSCFKRIPMVSGEFRLFSCVSFDSSLITCDVHVSHTTRAWQQPHI